MNFNGGRPLPRSGITNLAEETTLLQAGYRTSVTGTGILSKRMTILPLLTRFDTREKAFVVSQTR